MTVNPTSSIQYYAVASYNSCTYTSLSDSIKVVTSISNIINADFCAGSTYMFNGSAVTVGGIYFDTLLSAGGCDSIVTLNLTMKSLNKLTNLVGKTITSAQAGATYQWINCGDNSIIAGATSQSFTADTTGSYAVVVTFNGCSDTSLCVAISTAGLPNLSDLYNVSLYPNPTSDQVTITSDVLLNDIQVTDLNGKVILSQKVNGVSASLNLSNVESGIYMVILNSDKGSLTKQIVKK